MRKLSNILFLVTTLFALPLSAQLDLPAVVDSDVPDFGAVSSTWGHLQYYRPFGIKGVLLEQWSDLATTHPLTGEPLNTDRQGWFPHETNASAWSQMHPALTTPADTTAPSLMVNYKQGEAEFNDFTLWYHNSLGESIRYGLNSKLRSHTRFLGITPYSEQSHRLQIESQISEQSLKVEMGYNHQVNPLYMYELDTTLQFIDYNDALQIKSDRWDGSIHWQSYDSSLTGHELFAWVQGGLWDWPNHQEQSLSGLIYWGTRLQFKNWSPLEMKMGTLLQQLGEGKLYWPFLELNLPRLKWKSFTADIGVKNHSSEQWFPNIDLNFSRKPLKISYRTEQLVDLSKWDDPKSSLVHHFKAAIIFPWIEITSGYWTAQKQWRQVSGYYGRTRLTLPWDMQIEIEGSKLNNPIDWVWTEKQIKWELNQGFLLFDKELYGHLKVWGQHAFDPQTGALHPETFTIGSASLLSPMDTQHILNYTISGQVSSLIIGFTDSNILQDPMWSQYANVPWESEYMIMANQFTESRFRYLSLIWVFDN